MSFVRHLHLAFAAAFLVCFSQAQIDFQPTPLAPPPPTKGSGAPVTVAPPEPVTEAPTPAVSVPQPVTAAITKSNSNIYRTVLN